MTRIAPFDNSESSPDINKETSSCTFCKRNSQLYQIMMPFLYLMKVAGLYHHSQFTKSTKECNTKDKVIGNEGYKRKSATPSMVYSAVICIFLACNTIRTMSTFGMDKKFELSSFLWKLSIVAWMINCTTNALAFYRSSNQFNGLTNFFCELDNYSTERPPLFTRRRIIIYVILSCIVIAINMAYSSFLLFDSVLFEVMLAPLNSKYPNVVYYKVAILIVQFYMTCAWILSMVFMLIICAVLVDLFSHNNKCFQAQIIHEDYSLPPDFEKLRQKYLLLCRLVSCADNFLNAFNGVTLIVASLHLTINMYMLLWYDAVRDNTTVLLGTLFWTSGAVVQIILISFGGAMVNSKASEPLEYFYDISADSIPADKQIHVQMFLSKLNGPPVGLSALGMFVIDKPVILTILGLLASYFVVMVQFSPVFTGADDDSADLCNCTQMLLNATLQCHTSL